MPLLVFGSAGDSSGESIQGTCFRNNVPRIHAQLSVSTMGIVGYIWRRDRFGSDLDELHVNQEALYLCEFTG